MDMQQFWDRTAGTGTWAGYYDGPANAKTYNFFTRRQAVVSLLRNEGRFPRILDVGCGTGDYIEVADAHDGAFFGIDFAPAMIQQAVQRTRGHGEHNLFVVGSGERLPYRDGSFDLVLAMGYIEYFRDPGPPVVELRRVMKPGAMIVIQSFKWELFGNLGRQVVGPLMRRLRSRRRSAAPGNANPAGLPSDWVDTKYSKRELDDLMRRYGFAARGGVYNNFHCLPRRWRGRFPRAYIRGSEWIRRTLPSWFGFLAVNYIGKYVLEDPDADPSRRARAQASANTSAKARG